MTEKQKTAYEVFKTCEKLTLSLQTIQSVSAEILADVRVQIDDGDIHEQQLKMWMDFTKDDMEDLKRQVARLMGQTGIIYRQFSLEEE